MRPNLTFVFDLSGFNPSLDDEGNLTVELPMQPVAMFSEELQKELPRILGEKQANMILDEVAGLILRQVAGRLLADKMR